VKQKQMEKVQEDFANSEDKFKRELKKMLEEQEETK